MAKQRRTVTLDPEVHEFLSTEGVNASQLINRLVKNYNTAGGDRQTMLELRKQQIQSDIQELEARINNKQDALTTIQDQLATAHHETEQVIAEADAELPEHVRDPDNPAVENWADKAGLEPGEFLRRLGDHNR